jgi:5-methylthioribose kinase
LAIDAPPGYRAMSEQSLAGWLESLPAIRTRLGGAARDWRVREVGDGNLNLVFIVEGPAGDVCVKQALPYVRCVGESWPMPLERAFFEHRASVIQARHAPAQMPEMLHYDPALYLMVMERLHPHIIMRRGMIQGVVYPHFAEQIADYMAETLFHTSDLAMPAGEKKREVAVFCMNIELCKITEDLIFTDPYMVHARNRWTSPQLDQAAAAIRADAPLKRAVSALKLKFMTEAQALLHGDLHTGSIMVTPNETKVIDPEFAFFGPIGFDVGKLIGNLLLSYFSQDGHEEEPGARDAYREWILETTEQVWHGFAQRFVRLWDGPRNGDAYPPALFEGPEGQESLRTAQRGFVRRLFRDSLGYAGAAMIRRTLGLAHNIDLELIEDKDLRAACERLNLELARELILGAESIGSIEAVTTRARELRHRGPEWPG